MQHEAETSKNDVQGRHNNRKDRNQTKTDNRTNETKSGKLKQNRAKLDKYGIRPLRAFSISRRNAKLVNYVTIEKVQYRKIKFGKNMKISKRYS